MKVSSDAAKALDNKLEAPILSLIPETENDEDGEDRTSTVQFKLKSNPADADSPKYTMTMGYCDGSQSIRFHLKWYQNVNIVLRGLGVTTGPEQATLIEQMCKGTVLSGFRESIASQVQVMKAMAHRTAFNGCTRLTGESTVDFTTRREAVASAATALDVPTTPAMVDAALRSILKNACPYKALEKQKRYMRRRMRKPADMKVRAYANHLQRINHEELPLLPPGGPKQSLALDEILDIFMYGVPRQWSHEMDRQDFDPFACKNLNQVVDFCERFESLESPQKQQASSQQGKKSKTKKVKYQKNNSSGSSKKDGDKWCDFHESNTHNTSECEALKKMKAGGDKKSSGKKNWKGKSDDAKTFTKKELNAIVKKASNTAIKKVKKELKTPTKRKKSDDSDNSSVASLNAIELEEEMRDVDRQLAEFDFSKDTGDEISV